jgi:hypothetical protein
MMMCKRQWHLMTVFQLLKNLGKILLEAKRWQFQEKRRTFQNIHLQNEVSG